MNPVREPLTWVEIDLKAIQHNIKELRRLAARNTFTLLHRRLKTPVEILAVIKADAYGHGMIEVAKLLTQEKISHFVVSDVTEGIKLRQAGFKQSILIFESTLPSDVKDIADHHLTPTVCTFEFAAEFNQYAQKIKERLPVHVKIDTGMGRLGVSDREAFDFIKNVASLRNLFIEGIYTHFPVADTDPKFTNKQIESLFELVTRLDKTGLIIPCIHAANSMGLAGYKTHILNLVRPGLMIYGLYPAEGLKKKIHLKPAMSVKSKIIFLKEIDTGSSVSYGRTFTARRRMTVATLPLGYNDGYPRLLSNKGSVLIGGRRCPILGRVTMDQTVVDVSRVKDVHLGMPVVIVGADDGQDISLDELSQHVGTINYELACSLGNRLPRKFLV